MATIKSTSFIRRTWTANESSGDINVRWEPDTQRWCDPYNDVWLFRREDDDGKPVWFIEARNSRGEPHIDAIVRRSHELGRWEHNRERVWQMYWLLVFDTIVTANTYRADMRAEMHIVPLGDEKMEDA